MNIFCDNCTTLDHQVRIQNPRSKDDWRYGDVKGEIMNKFCDNCTTLGHQVRIQSPTSQIPNPTFQIRSTRSESQIPSIFAMWDFCIYSTITSVLILGKSYIIIFADIFSWAMKRQDILKLPHVYLNGFTLILQLFLC